MSVMVYNLAEPQQYGAINYTVEYVHNSTSQFKVYSNYLTRQIADISPTEKARLYQAARSVYLMEEVIGIGRIYSDVHAVEVNTRHILQLENALSGIANGISLAVAGSTGNGLVLGSAVWSIVSDALEQGPTLALWSIGKAYAETLRIIAPQVIDTYNLGWYDDPIDVSKVNEAWAATTGLYNLAATAMATMQQAADIDKTGWSSFFGFVRGVFFAVAGSEALVPKATTQFVELAGYLIKTMEVTGNIIKAQSFLDGYAPAVNFPQLTASSYLRYVNAFDPGYFSGKSTDYVISPDGNGNVKVVDNLHGGQVYTIKPGDAYELTFSDGVKISLNNVLQGAQNKAPVARPNEFHIPFAETFSGRNVVADDYDPDGPAPTVIARTTTSANGVTVTIHADGTFTYVAPASGPATDSFTYQIRDSKGKTDTGTVTLDLYRPVSSLPAPSIGETDVVAQGPSNAPVLQIDGWRRGRIDAEPLEGASAFDKAYDSKGSTNTAQLVDRDFYKVWLEQGTQYRFEARNVDITTGSVAISLRDETGTRIDLDHNGNPNDDFRSGPNPQLQDYTPSRSGWFFVAVSASSSDDVAWRTATGSYDARFSAITPAPVYSGATTNRNPIAVDDRVSLGNGQSFLGNVRDGSLSLGIADSDPDGDSVLVDAGTITSARGALVQMQANGAFSYTAPATGGTDSFQYTLRDGRGLTDTATVTLTLSGGAPGGDNRAPIAQNDSASVNYGESVRIAVLGNDYDPDNDPRFIAYINLAGLRGSVMENADGTITYTAPTSGTTDTFSYRVMDVHDLLGGTATVTVNLTPGTTFASDLAISNVHVDAASVRRDNQTTIHYTITNTGQTAATNFNVGLYLSEDTTVSPSEAPYSTRYFTSLAPGETRAIDTTVILSRAEGNYNVLVKADYQDTIAESREDNNLGNAVPLTITSKFTDAADFVTGGVYLEDSIDPYHALGGDDYIQGALSGCTVYGDAGNDIIYGQNLADNLFGGADSDQLFGGGGGDIEEGGAGNDTLRGNDGDDILRGDEGNDDLSGDAGADMMSGGRGDDTYNLRLADDAADNIVENIDEGLDSVWLYGAVTGNAAEFSYTLPGNVEVLWAAFTTGNLDFTGNDRGNQILAGNGDNKLRGGAGNDYLSGGGGTDTAIYSGKSTDYLVTFGHVAALGTDEGIDTLSGVEYVEFLGDGVRAKVEDLIASPFHHAPGQGAIGGNLVVKAPGPGTVYQTSSTALADGGFLVVWAATGDGTDITARRYDASGQPAGAEWRVNAALPGTQQFPTVAGLGDGGFIAVWEDDRQDGSNTGIAGQRFDAAGNRVGSTFTVNPTIASAQGDPNVAALADSGFVVTWNAEFLDGSSYGVFGQRYSAAGVRIGAEFRANEYSADSQAWSSVDALSGGGFVVTWMSDYQDGSGSGIYARIFNAGGAAVGGEFRVNTTTDLHQSMPSLTGLADGGFIVAWGSGIDQTIYAQRYDANGALIGGQVKVNEHSLADSYSATVQGLPDGGYVIAWAGNAQDGSGIFAKRYDAAGVLVEGEHAVSALQAGSFSDPSIAALANGGYAISWRSLITGASGYQVSTQLYQDPGLVRFDDTRNVVDLSSGDKIVDARGGDDVIMTSDVGTTVFGGDGDDYLVGGDGGDTLKGGKGSDVLYAKSGNDVVEGGEDDDILIAGAGLGNDSYDGGSGSDTLVLSSTSRGVAVDLGRGLAKGAEIGTDTLSQIENVVGGSGNDTVLGAAGANIIDGGAGADRMTGLGGDDSYYVDNAADRVTEAAAGGIDTIYSAVSYVLSTEVETLVLRGAAKNGTGNAAANTITGNALDNVLSGLAGDDTIAGMAGNDILIGGLGADALDGGEGTDAASYRTATAAITLDLGTPANDLGDAAGDMFTSIEVYELSSLADTFIGSLQSDTVLGGGGLDTLSGGDGDDVIDGGAGADKIDGGSGSDTVAYLTSAQAITLDLGNLKLSTGDAAADAYTSIEAFRLTRLADTLRGSSSSDIVDGEAGDDAMSGGDGADTLRGGAGNDTVAGDGGQDQLHGDAGQDRLDGGADADSLDGGTGDDLLIGGAGADALHGGTDGGGGGGTGSDVDTASYETSLAGITLDLATPGNSTGDAIGDTYDDIERYRLTALADAFEGSAGDDWVEGGRGADALKGGDGDDRLDGGADADTLDGGSDTSLTPAGPGGDVASYLSSAAAITLDLTDTNKSTGDAKGDVYVDIEIFELTAFGDTLQGSGAADRVSGAGGNDILRGGNGADILAGGEDNDKLEGGLGADILSGDGGNDTLKGGDADDVLYGDGQTGSASGDDKLYGEAGGDTLYGGSGNDTLDGGLGGDSLYGGADADMLLGGAGDDQLFGGDGADKLDGGSENDRLDGGAANDALTGGLGDDVLSGGLGADTLTGGLGADRFLFLSAADGGDVIKDYAFALGDRIELQGSGFGGLSAGAMSSSLFETVASGGALNAATRFIYDTTLDKLFYDEDGSGSATAILLASFSSRATVLSASDFVVS